MAARVGWFKKLWIEKPELVGSSFMAGLGLVMIVGSCKYYYDNNKDFRRYKEFYTVIRHDDPRVATVRQDYLGDRENS